MPLPNQRQEGAPGLFPQLDRDMGVIGCITANQLAKEASGQRRIKPQSKPPFLAAAVRTGRRRGVVDVAQSRPGLRKETLAGARQAGAAGAPLEQGDLQMLFERLHPSA